MTALFGFSLLSSPPPHIAEFILDLLHLDYISPLTLKKRGMWRMGNNYIVEIFVLKVKAAPQYSRKYNKHGVFQVINV